MLAWLPVWTEEQLIGIWSGWYYCHLVISCFTEIQNSLSFCAGLRSPRCHRKEFVIFSLSRGTGAKYCGLGICDIVCMSSLIYQQPYGRTLPYFLHVDCSHGLVLVSGGILLCYILLFFEHVIFTHQVPYGASCVFPSCKQSSMTAKIIASIKPKFARW